MGRGFVAQVSKEGIRVTLDKRLRPAFAGHAQRAPSGDLPGAGGVVQWAGEALPEDTALLSWRLDKDDVASVFVRLRRNLMGALWMPDVIQYRVRALRSWGLSSAACLQRRHPPQNAVTIPCLCRNWCTLRADICMRTMWWVAV